MSKNEAFDFKIGFDGRWESIGKIIERAKELGLSLRMHFNAEDIVNGTFWPPRTSIHKDVYLSATADSDLAAQRWGEEAYFREQFGFSEAEFTVIMQRELIRQIEVILRQAE